MERNMECPICGQINKEQYETMDFWGEQITCEDYYTCPNCGYWMDMCYSDVYEGIDIYSIKQLKPLLKNYKKAKQFKIRKHS